MALPTFTIRELLESGVHFGHTTRRWNPKMAPYIFGKRNRVHILDLEQTVPLLHQALVFIRDVVAGGGRVLFVGTKRQASEKIAESAKRCGQYYVNHRWLGGMLTNWKTISLSIKRLHQLDQRLEEGESGFTKKELLKLTRERDKLERALGGIKEIGGLPDVLFVIDTNKEHIAVAEARVLKIPVVAILDSNSDPAHIDYPIPGNDDASRAIGLYCELMSDAVLDGIQTELTASGADLGAAEEAPAEALPKVNKTDAPAAQASEAPAVGPTASGDSATGAADAAPKPSGPEEATKTDTPTAQASEAPAAGPTAPGDGASGGADATPEPSGSKEATEADTPTAQAGEAPAADPTAPGDGATADADAAPKPSGPREGTKTDTPAAQAGADMVTAPGEAAAAAAPEDRKASA